jgi:hypothetical protein
MPLGQRAVEIVIINCTMRDRVLGDCTMRDMVLGDCIIKDMVHFGTKVHMDIYNANSNTQEWQKLWRKKVIVQLSILMKCDTSVFR